MGDMIHPFQIESVGVRGRLVRLDDTVRTTVARHGYPDDVAELLAEALVLAGVLASGLKYDGIFTLQVRGDGPVGLLVSDVTSDGDMRGYARFDEERLAAATAPAMAGLAPVPRLLGAGAMAFTVDQGPDTERRQRYQGLAELDGATLADCAHHYFRQSEQVETALVVAATASQGAALTLQRLPASGPGRDDADEAWRHAVVMMSSVTRAELLSGSLTPADVLFRLFHEDGVRLYEPRPLRFRCRCSQERVEGTLRSFPRAEVEAMALDGRVEVTCEFCKETYIFDGTALEALYDG